MSKFETKKIEINGRKVRYLHGGKGKPLIFLHGFPMNPKSHKPSLEILADEFTVYAPYLFDLKCSNAKDVADSLAVMAKKLGIKTSTVVGISFGGFVAGFLASSDNKKLISQLFLVDCAGVPRRASKKHMVRRFFISSAKMIAKGYFLNVIYRVRGLFSFFGHYWRRENRAIMKELDVGTHICYIFGKITAETVIVWGKRDGTFSVSNTGVLKKLIKNSKIVLVDGTHSWPYHYPRLFAEVIIKNSKQTF
jgi:pimeloyl-ACP methyl ester carboxylesterase